MGMKQILVMMAAVVVLVGCGEKAEPLLTPEAPQAVVAEAQVAIETEPVLPVNEKLIVEKAVRWQLEKPEGELTEADFEKVTHLFLHRTQITDAGLKDVAKLQKLEILRLDFTKVTKAGVSELKKALPNCYIQGP